MPHHHQIQRVLPKSAWDNVIINESNELLILVKETNKLKIGGVQKSYKPSLYVRKTVADMLYQASESLPENVAMVLIEGWRSVGSQQLLWDSKWNSIKTNNPDWNDEKIDQEVRMVIARPSALANHHCGGAVDVTLAFQSGGFVDMGSVYAGIEFDPDMRKKFPMHSEFIDAAAAENRAVLRNAMESAGFVWYPGEWWHYCWGDRMWAVYTGRSECFYGPVEL